LEIYNPNPVPAKDFVANLVNNLGSIPGSIPVPGSFTLITTSSLSSFFSELTDIVPSSVDLTALLNRL